MFRKFNWGHGLLIIIVLFMSGMLYLVSLCLNENFDLVTKDYYEKELAYQSQIDRFKNTSALSTPVRIQYDKSASSIQIELPEEFKDISLPLNIHLYKPDNARLDKSLVLQAQQSHTTIPAETLSNGLWRVQITWSNDGKEYYSESSIHIH